MRVEQERDEIIPQLIDFIAGNSPEEIEGSITAVNTTARTITVNGVVVAYGSARFKDGTAADLRVGAKVEVKGTGPVGGVVTATSIEFDD